jgi:hypothetical protein
MIAMLNAIWDPQRLCLERMVQFFRAKKDQVPHDQQTNCWNRSQPNEDLWRCRVLDARTGVDTATNLLPLCNAGPVLGTKLP